MSPCLAVLGRSFHLKGTSELPMREYLDPHSHSSFPVFIVTCSLNRVGGGW